MRALIALAVIGTVCGTQLGINPRAVVAQVEQIVNYGRDAAASLPGLREEIAACTSSPASSACINGDGK